jgi:hypothetical protein
MSTLATITPMLLPLITRPARAFFAPVERLAGTPTIFDPSMNSNWRNSTPVAPWIDLGWISGLKRTSESTIGEASTGAPETVRLQVRRTLSAVVSFQFMTWSKLSMALATSSQHMNLLTPAISSAPVGSGGKALSSMGIQPGSSAMELYIASSASLRLQAGSLVVVDEDYTAQTGFIGAGISAAYVNSANSVARDTDYIRRVSFNIGRIVAVSGDGGLQLANPLPAGTPTSSMKVQQLNGFVDREGGSFFHEWSALFVVEGLQGETLFYHYPRLQTCQGAAEVNTPLSSSSLMVTQLDARFRAFPVTDGNDGEQILCYRSFIPGRVNHV